MYSKLKELRQPIDSEYFQSLLTDGCTIMGDGEIIPASRDVNSIDAIFSVSKSLSERNHGVTVLVKPVYADFKRVNPDYALLQTYDGSYVNAEDVEAAIVQVGPCLFGYDFRKN
ncbi:MAG: hypothetical protein ACMXYK_02845 [Candidatus Woesearchaeota archaeon]